MAKRSSWVLNAARRTLLTAVPSMAQPDDEYAASLLSEPEYLLFSRLDAAEREHAVGVANCVATAQHGANQVLLRAALLHDIGKLGFANNALWRIVSHLFPARDVPAEPRLSGLAGVRQAARHHAEYGRALILAAGGDPEVARLVGAHHDPGDDLDAKALRDCDELT